MPDAKNKSTALIIGTGLIAAEVIASELRARLTKFLGDRVQYLTEQELVAQARAILFEFEPILAESIDRTTLAGWIAGFDDVSKKLPPYILDTFGRMMGGPPRPPGGLIIPAGFEDDDEPIVSFPMIEKAARSLLDRNVMTRREFDAASQAARNQAFTVAGEISNETLETIRDVLGETVDEGASLESFRRNLGGRLEKSFSGPAHLETVFRTNVNTAFHDGMDALADNPIVDEIFPYQEYLPIHDARARPEHTALGSLGIDGTGIYRRDDPFWNLFTPSWDFNCRCGTNMLTIEAAARGGVREAESWLRTGQRPPLVSRLPFIPFRPPAGFGMRRVAA